MFLCITLSVIIASWVKTLCQIPNCIILALDKDCVLVFWIRNFCIDLPYKLSDDVEIRYRLIKNLTDYTKIWILSTNILTVDCCVKANNWLFYSKNRSTPLLTSCNKKKVEINALLLFPIIFSAIFFYSAYSICYVLW
jgi:hypothetical protein